MHEYLIAVRQGAGISTISPDDIKAFDGEGVFAVNLNSMLSVILDRRAALAAAEAAVDDDDYEAEEPIPVVVPENAAPAEAPVEEPAETPVEEPAETPVEEPEKHDGQ